MNNFVSNLKMFLRNYLIQRDLSIQKTVTQKENYFLTMHHYVLREQLGNVVKQYFPLGKLLSVPVIPLYIEYALSRPNTLEQVIKSISRNADEMIIIPKTGESKLIAITVQNDAPILEVCFINNEGTRVKYYDQDMSFENIMKDIKSECDKL